MWMPSNESFPLKEINVNNWNSRAVMGSAMFFWLTLCSYNMLRRGIDTMWGMVTSWSHLILQSSALKGWSERLLHNGEDEQKEPRPGGSLAQTSSHWRSTSIKKSIAKRKTCWENFPQNTFLWWSCFQNLHQKLMRAILSGVITAGWQFWRHYLPGHRNRFYFRANFIHTYNLAGCLGLVAGEEAHF